MRVKEHPELDDSPFLNEKEHKYFQHIIGVYQWLVVAGIFYLAYDISSFSRFLCAPRVGHIELVRKIFGYLNKYPIIGYAINPQPLTIYDDCDNVRMKYYWGNQYAYFSEDFDEQFLGIILDELDIRVFVGIDHRHDKVTGRSITGFFQWKYQHP